TSECNFCATSHSSLPSSRAFTSKRWPTSPPSYKPNFHGTQENRDGYGKLDKSFYQSHIGAAVYALRAHYRRPDVIGRAGAIGPTSAGLRLCDGLADCDGNWA